MEGVIIGRNFPFENGLGLTNKNSLKHYENSLKQLALTVHGHIFGRACYWRDKKNNNQKNTFSCLFYLYLFFCFNNFQFLGQTVCDVNK